MENKTSLAVSTVIASWLGLLGLGCIVIGLSGALAPEEMVSWMRGLMWTLAISGALIIYGAITMYIAARKKSVEIEKDKMQLIREMSKPVIIEDAIRSVQEAAAKPIPDKNTLLAHWTYSPDEWQQYTKHEFKYRLREALLLWVLIAALGTWILADYDDMGYISSFTLSFIMGGIFTLIRYNIAKSEHKANSSRAGDVVISAKAIIINGKYHILNDENKTMSEIDLLKDQTPPIIEFTVEWNTRSGRTNEQVRIPVPATKTEEAEKLISIFKNEVIGKY